MPAKRSPVQCSWEGCLLITRQTTVCFKHLRAWRKIHKPEIVEKQRKSDERTNAARAQRYTRTKNGYLCLCYGNMRRRVLGWQKNKRHLYEGKEILDRKEFYSWARYDEQFNSLFIKWKEAGQPLKLAPSIDRIDPNKGYILSNMRWITHSENSRIGSINRHRKYGHKVTATY